MLPTSHMFGRECVDSALWLGTPSIAAAVPRNTAYTQKCRHGVAAEGRDVSLKRVSYQAINYSFQVFTYAFMLGPVPFKIWTWAVFLDCAKKGLSRWAVSYLSGVSCCWQNGCYSHFPCSPQHRSKRAHLVAWLSPLLDLETTSFIVVLCRKVTNQSPGVGVPNVSSLDLLESLGSLLMWLLSLTPILVR